VCSILCALCVEFPNFSIPVLAIISLGMQCIKVLINEFRCDPWV
jgi:hypothetical protein